MYLRGEEKMKKRKSTLALVLAISLIISGIPQITFGLSNNKELNDPFEMMIDSTPELLSIKEIIDSSCQPNCDNDVGQMINNIVNTNLQPSDYENVEEVKKLIEETADEISHRGTNVEIDSALLEDILKQQQDLVEQSKTNRFIVKYRDKGENSFKSKVGDKIQDMIEIDNPATENCETSVKGQSEESTLDSAGKFFKKTLNGLMPLNSYEEKTRFLTLEESVNPSEFADTLRKKGIGDDIEYIQPDFQMNLQGLGSLLPERSGQMPTSDYKVSIEKFDTAEEATTDKSISQEKMKDKIISQNLSEKSQNNNDRVIIALIDSGIDITHPKLQKYIYANKKEVPDNNIDDDENGYTDDVSGWNFPDNSAIVYNKKLGLEQAHATHIAGIIAGASDADKNLTPNNNISILPLQVFSNGKAYTSDIIAAINYAEKMGAKIVNCSFGSTDNNPALRDAIKKSEMIFVCSVGNARADLDVNPIYPACFGLDNIINVTSTNADGGLSYFSNYSKNLVDIAAKGRDVKSTLPGGKYGLQNGTSMATAMVSRIAAEILIRDNNLDSAGLKKRIINTSDRLSNLQEEVVAGRQINIINAINNVEQTSVVHNSAESDFDVKGYNPTQDELNQLYSSSSIKQVSAAKYFSLILKNDGTVWAWGSNSRGQCGNGSVTESMTLTQVIGMTNVVKIATGGNHSLALKSDGTVWAWGYNDRGQLGDDSMISKAIPVQVLGLNNIASVAAGTNHSIAIDSDGLLWAWGRNDCGQLGDGTTGYRLVPKWNDSTMDFLVKSIVAGEYYSLAVHSDGYLWAWGRNDCGQLGDGSKINKNIPVQVKGIDNVIDIDAGIKHSLAMKSDGSLWAWGCNDCGQLGDGTKTDKIVPSRVLGLNSIAHVNAGINYSLAVKSDGSLWTWGDNQRGQLGDGSSNDKIMPVKLSGIQNVFNVVSGDFHSLALKRDGTVWAWGDNDFAQLGDGNVRIKDIPTQINGENGWTKIVAGDTHSLALKSDGTVWAWGSNESGKLGIGYDSTTIIKTKPVQVLGLNNVTSIAAGRAHNLALKSDGTVWAWGDNAYGQCGKESQYGGYTTLTQVNGITNVIKIEAGAYYSLALKSNGTVWAWGNNSRGQLGDDTIDNRSTPVQVRILNSVVDIGGGQDHSLALRSDGTVWTWGDNWSGELGDDTCNKRTTPAQVKELTGVIDIAAGKDYSLAVKSGGTLWAWGLNNAGQLGDGTCKNRIIPVQVKGINEVSRIVAGEKHSLACKTNGTVWAWGNNERGQLGDGTNINTTTPVQVKELIDAIDIAVGKEHSLAVKPNEAVCTWGNNDYGQLGQSKLFYSNVPIQCHTNKGLFCYESNSYTAEIPCSGVNKISVHASGTDHFGNIIESSQITYNLGTTYSGISINSTTGEIIIEPSAQSGSVSIIAKYNDLSCSTMLKLIKMGGEPFKLSTATGRTYSIPLTASNISGFKDKSFTLNYDSSVLQPVDLCAFTSAKETISGVIPGTGITIKSVSDGNIVMMIDKSIPDGKKWSGVINIIKFKAKTTEETSVTLKYN